MFATLTIFPATRPSLCRAQSRAAASDVAEDARRRRGGRSLYEVLRVKRDASPVEIKAAYRTLAKLYHPDSKLRFVDQTEAAYHGGGGGDFIEIREAYGTLSDPDARATYDCTLGGSRNKTGSGQRVGIYSTRRWETDQCW